MSSTCSAFSMVQVQATNTNSTLGLAWKAMGILVTLGRLRYPPSLHPRSVASQDVRSHTLIPFREAKPDTLENRHSKKSTVLQRIHQVVYYSTTHLFICQQKATSSLHRLSMRTSLCCHSNLSVMIRLHKRVASRALTAPVSSATSAMCAAVKLAKGSRALCSAPPVGGNIIDVVIRTP